MSLRRGGARHGVDALAAPHLAARRVLGLRALEPGPSSSPCEPGFRPSSGPIARASLNASAAARIDRPQARTEPGSRHRPAAPVPTAARRAGRARLRAPGRCRTSRNRRRRRRRRPRARGSLEAQRRRSSRSVLGSSPRKVFHRASGLGPNDERPAPSVSSARRTRNAEGPKGSMSRELAVKGFPRGGRPISSPGRGEV